MSLINAWRISKSPLQVLIIRGAAAPAMQWAADLGVLYAPSRMIFAIPSDAPDLPPALAAKSAAGGTVAYLCTGMTCSAPLTSLEDASRVLNARG